MSFNFLLVGSTSERELGSINVIKIILYVILSSAAAQRALGPANGYPLGASGIVVFTLTFRTRCSEASCRSLFLITTDLWVSDEISRF